MIPRYRLYGTPTSYYTAKLRAYLDYKGIPYDEILTTEDVYRDVIVARTGVWMIPTLITPEDQVHQDSTDIIDVLERRFTSSPVHPGSARQKLAALLLELYGDEWLIMTAIHYRWTKSENRAFAISEFGRQARPNGSPLEQQAAGLEKARVFGGWVTLFGIDAVTGPAIEEAYEEMLAALERHFRSHDFLFGSRPSIADFSLFGGLYAVLLRDPFSGKLLRRLAPKVVDWVERMRHPRPGGGEFIAGDEVPATLNPLLSAVFSDQLPVIRDTLGLIRDWVVRHPGQALPKTIGEHAFTLRGRQGMRRVYPYPQWMLQRVLTAYRALPASDKERVDGWMGDLGVAGQLDIDIACPLERQEFQLVAAQPPY